jgi:hypothetical protein
MSSSPQEAGGATTSPALFRQVYSAAAPRYSNCDFCFIYFHFFGSALVPDANPDPSPGNHESKNFTFPLTLFSNSNLIYIFTVLGTAPI